MATETVPPMRWSRVLAPVLLGIGLMALVAAILVPSPWQQSRSQRIDRPNVGEQGGIAYPLPEFTLTERSGASVSRQDLLGKVWVASFVFARCTGPCPSVTSTMARLQTELNLADSADLRLVTFTVDPERDNPAELTKYAATVQAHPDRWLFLTGPEPQIHELLNKSFKVQAGPSQNPHPPEGQEFDHSTRLAVVDKFGTVRGYFDGYRGPNDPDGESYTTGLVRLKELVAELLAE